MAHLPTEVAHILSVLGDLNLLHHLSEGSTIACTILPHHAYLLRSFRLERLRRTKRYLMYTRYYLLWVRNSKDEDDSQRFFLPCAFSVDCYIQEEVRPRSQAVCFCSSLGTRLEEVWLRSRVDDKGRWDKGWGSAYNDGWTQARKCKAKEGSVSFSTYFWRPHSFIHCYGFLSLVDTGG